MSASFWDQRYGGDEYAYGETPNDFVKRHAARFQGRHVLCLAEGEGRNAVYLAEHGARSVTMVDYSAVGLLKAKKLAARRGVILETVLADLANYNIPEEVDGVLAVFAHVPPPVRRGIHQQMSERLPKGALYLAEAYRPGQIELGTGGPKDPDLLWDLSVLSKELPGFDFLIAQEMDREIHEGIHQGRSKTLQCLAVRV